MKPYTATILKTIAKPLTYLQLFWPVPTNYFVLLFESWRSYDSCDKSAGCGKHENLSQHPELAKSTQKRKQRGNNTPDVEKPQQCRKCFLQYSTFTPKRLHAWTWGAKLVSYPGRHLNSVRPYFDPRITEDISPAVTASYRTSHK